MSDTQTLNGSTRVSLLETAYQYREQNLSIIPVQKKSKIPLSRWQEYQTRFMTDDELCQFGDDDLNIGLVCGKISGIIVVDCEAGADTSDLPATVCSETGGGGKHFFYKYPADQDAVKNAVRIRSLTDIRGDGGYVVAPPSTHPNGQKYKWLTPFDRNKLPDFPINLFKAENIEKREKINFKNPVKILEGSRNDTLTRIAGKKISELPTHLWESVGLQFLQMFNKLYCSPALSESEVSRIFASIMGVEAEKRKQETGSVRKNEKFIFSLNELLSEKIEVPQPLVEGLLNKGDLSILAGEAKIGKSILALYLASALVTGNTFMNFPISGRKRVLFLEEEDGSFLLRERIMKISRGMDFKIVDSDPLYFGVRTGFKITNDDWFVRLSKELETLKPDLLIFDCLNRIHLDNENDQKAMTCVMDKIDFLRRTFGCAILVIHHFRKQAQNVSNHGQARLRGSTVLSAYADTLIYVNRSADNSRRIEIESKAFQIDPFGYEVVKTESGDLSLLYKADLGLETQMENAKTLLEAISSAQPEENTLKNLAEKTGFSRNSVSAYAKLLENDKEIRKFKAKIGNRMIYCYEIVKDMSKEVV